MGEEEGECPVRLKKDVNEPALLPKNPDLHARNESVCLDLKIGLQALQEDPGASSASHVHPCIYPPQMQVPKG